VKSMFLDSKRFRKIAVVTSDFHCRRALLIFRSVLGNDYLVDCIPVRHRYVNKEILVAEKDYYKLHKFLFKFVGKRYMLKLILMIGLEITRNKNPFLKILSLKRKRT